MAAWPATSPGSTSNVVTQTVTTGSISTTSVLTSVVQPVELRPLGHLHRHGLGLLGHAGWHGDLLQLQRQRPVRTKTSLGTGHPDSSGKATYSTSSLPVGTTVYRGHLHGHGQLHRLDLQLLSQVVKRRVHLGPHPSPNPSTYGSSVTFTDTVSATTGTPGGTVTFYSCTTNTCGTKTSLGTGTLSLGQGHLLDSALPVGTTYVEAVYGASGNYGGSTSNVVPRWSTRSGPPRSSPSSPNPSSYGTSVTFTDTVSASTGTPGGTVTFYSCTNNTCSTKTSLGTETLARARPPSRRRAAGGDHLCRGDLRGLGQLRGLDVERGGPGGQRGLDHHSPHPLAQPIGYGTSVSFTATVSAARARRAARSPSTTAAPVELCTKSAFASGPRR